MTKTMKLVGSIENKITNERNGENISHLKITEITLVSSNITNNSYQQELKVLYTFVPNTLNKFYIRHLIQSFHILNYGLQIKIVNL